MTYDYIIGILIILIVGIAIFLGSLKDNMLKVNAKTIQDKNMEKASMNYMDWNSYKVQ